MRIGKWAIAALGAWAVAASPACAAARLPLLTHHGRWLTDPQGRVVILHGVQIDRFRPGTVIEYTDLTPANVALIAGVGFNLARVSLAYAGYETRPSRFDQSYTTGYLRFDRLLAANRIYDLLDLMQGQYNAQLDGFGFPDWMTLTSGAPNVPRPFPQGYLYDPAEERAWDNLWANARAQDGTGLQDHYAAGLKRLAATFASSPGLLGFDLLNEPWPGSAWPTCANPQGCPAFDPQLTGFYRKLIGAIRVADKRHPVLYEPHALFDEGAATSIGSVGDRNAVFTFHNYCLGDQPGLPQSDPGQDCGIEERMVLANAETQSRRTGDGVLEDEWGNSTSRPLIERMTGEADADMVGWSYWAYEDCCNSPGAIVADGSKPPQAPNNLRRPLLDALVRPYPQLIAGTPTRWSFDQATGAFHFAYTTRPVAASTFNTGVRTRVELPALRYPTGYTASATGARVVSAPDADPLLLVAQPAAKRVSLTVTPANHHPRAATNPVPEDCTRSPAHTIRLRTPHPIALYVDGEPVAHSHGGAIRLPAGLANGSIVQLRGMRFSRTWLVQGCALELRPRRR